MFDHISPLTFFRARNIGECFGIYPDSEETHVRVEVVGIKYEDLYKFFELLYTGKTTLTAMVLSPKGLFLTN